MQAVDDINDDLEKSPLKPFCKLKLGAIKETPLVQGDRWSYLVRLW